MLSTESRMRGNMQVRFGGRYGKTYRRKSARRPVPSLRLGKGGNLLALAAELHPSSDISGLLRQIAERNPPVRPVSVSAGKPPSEEPAFRHLATLPLTSHALLAYLSERGIGAETARRECREIRYECRGKRYYAVGFPNIAGGFELRSRYFKGCVSPKSVSVIPHGCRY